jgi:hypothetical protein
LERQRGAVKAIYQDGQIRLVEPARDQRPVEVMATFPKNGPDLWEPISSEVTARPAFAKFM